MKCKNCGYEISSEEKRCPICGEEVIITEKNPAEEGPSAEDYTDTANKLLYEDKAQKEDEQPEKKENNNKTKNTNKTNVRSKKKRPGIIHNKRIEKTWLYLCIAGIIAYLMMFISQFSNGAPAQLRLGSRIWQAYYIHIRVLLYTLILLVLSLILYLPFSRTGKKSLHRITGCVLVFFGVLCTAMAFYDTVVVNSNGFSTAGMLLWTGISVIYWIIQICFLIKAMQTGKSSR